MIAVLPPDCSDGVLAEIQRDASARGWSFETSRGPDQTILSVSGATTRGELEELLGSHVDADVFELYSRRRYEQMARRRSQMHGLVGGLGILVALAFVVPAFGFLRAPPEALTSRDVARVGSVDDLAPNEAKLVRVDGERLFVVRLSKGRTFALAATCTYVDHCQLEWNRDRLQLVCPCDGGVFDVHGGVVQGPPFAPLRSYPVELIHGSVYVRRR